MLTSIDICQGNGQSCCTCDDNNPCTVDTCDILTGDCIFTPVSCNQSADACYTNQCELSTGNCVEQTLNCDDDNVCTIDSCHSQAGCTYLTVSCDDNNACTNDNCDPVSCR
jgi:hypothetical protein